MEHPNNLRALRAEAKMKQAEVAEALGIHQTAYGKIEQGRIRIGSYLNDLAGILNCTADDIMVNPEATPPMTDSLLTDILVYALPEIDGDSVRFDTSMVSKTPRPDFLSNAQNAFAMFNCGNSMFPRFKHGDFLYCDPSSDLKDDDAVVVVLKAGNRLIARVRQHMGGGVFAKLDGSEETDFEGALEFSAPVIGVKLSRV